ncbi:hypothetical protein CEXT_312701 [Caerostris extrusa]|uniref:Uncharacterized protein n=1 Tax=Caerostris extrusa TaxID=172846 RepID=A0AAV4UIH2_CAEEX|nr:hypothetical protein CEXT_312701 [Caerostris extrusa]
MATDKCLYRHVAPVGAAIGSHVTGRRRSSVSHWSPLSDWRGTRNENALFSDDKLRLRRKMQLQHREGFVFATVFVSTPPSHPLHIPPTLGPVFRR